MLALAFDRERLNLRSSPPDPAEGKLIKVRLAGICTPIWRSRGYMGFEACSAIVGEVAEAAIPPGPASGGGRDQRLLYVCDLPVGRADALPPLTRWASR